VGGAVGGEGGTAAVAAVADGRRNWGSGSLSPRPKVRRNGGRPDGRPPLTEGAGSYEVKVLPWSWAGKLSPELSTLLAPACQAAGPSMSPWLKYEKVQGPV
jgi:hypothetical protein